MSQQKDYVVAERPRLSAAAVLLLILILMNAISIFAAMSYWSRLQSLSNEVKTLQAQLRALAKDIEILNENIKHYKKIDQLVQLYIQQMVLKTYKELFPEMSEEELKELLKEMISESTKKTSGAGTNTSEETVVIKG